MNYEKIYNSLIQKRLINKIDSTICYCEQHHIRPVSLYPDLKDEQTNIVALTAREHYVAHKLLVEIYKQSKGIDSKEYRCMLNALWYISHTKKHKDFVTSKEYQLLKENISKMMSESRSGKNHWHYGGKNSLETRAKISQANKGNVWSEERKKKFGQEHSGKNNANYGHKWTDEQKMIASQNRKGIYNGNAETRLKQSKRMSGIKNPMYGKSSWEKCTLEERIDRIKRFKKNRKGKCLGKNCFTGKSLEQKKQITDKMSFSQRDRWNHMDAQTYEEGKLKKKYAAAKSHLNYQLRKLLLLMIISRVFE